MKFLLLILLFSVSAYSTGQDKPDENEEYRKEYYDENGNKVVENYDKLLRKRVRGQDGSLRDAGPMLRRRTVYVKDTNDTKKVETYSRLHGELSRIYYYKDNEIYITESYYPHDYSIRDRNRQTRLKYRSYQYSPSCSCSEIHDGRLEIQELRVYSGGNVTSHFPEEGKSLKCSRELCN